MSLLNYLLNVETIINNFNHILFIILNINKRMKKVCIEISKDSKIKYEYNEETKMMELDRILHNSNSFPYNYGFIPDTLSPDGDPVDIIVLCDYELLPGCVTKVKIIGGIETSDEKGKDDKIIAVLDDKIDPKSKYINNLDDINKYELDNIIYFLKHYKDNEKNKFVNIGKIYNKAEALEVVSKYSL